MNNETRNESQALPESIRCVGADDLTLSLFENQYPVQPLGVSYNSYLARGNEGPARVRHRGVAAQRARPCKRSADGSADHGAVREINI